ncbi:hypothetical protein [Vibrio vulnificus]|uniref:Uncharacterized protein n=1 Tax=Vibrio vulnificus TaxID=672 RepID=A0ABX4WU76_VIBVL|nr:hypothetical protein [Vibrio vulnificus]AVX00901.1 hypothetical protein BJD94_14360 [Vibrio vulnificus Env1]EGQ7995476.1 hypothetical protein [Vibrio vulnificus]EGQ9936159.1 hypothetical protein [Vibrio vulnificus]EHU9517834.1 hypothetical protein [Vibrio vulnificus]EID4339278.1 hypothetical protein [Vibrio vulnificus]
MNFLSLDEQDIKNEISDKNEKIFELESILYWNFTPRRAMLEESSVAFVVFGIPSLFSLSGTSSESHYLILFVSFFSLLAGLLVRATGFKPKTYYYELTSAGIRYTSVSNVHKYIDQYHRAVSITVVLIGIIFIVMFNEYGLMFFIFIVPFFISFDKSEDEISEIHILPNSFVIKYDVSVNRIYFISKYSDEMRSLEIYDFERIGSIYISRSQLYQLTFHLKNNFDVTDVVLVKN